MSSRAGSSPNGSVFTSQFGGGATAAGTPLRGTINIKLSSQSGTVAALRGSNAASSLVGAGDEDSEETNSSPQQTSPSSLLDSSPSSSQVLTDVAAINSLCYETTQVSPGPPR